jgi:hypothetical protein
MSAPPIHTRTDGASCLSGIIPPLASQLATMPASDRFDEVDSLARLSSNSASNASELTACKRKHKCRNEDEYDSSLEVHSCPPIRTELTKIINTVRYSKNCRNTTWRQLVHLRITVLNSMDKWQITSRVEELRREILQIREANRNYKRKPTHTVSEIDKHAERQRRLQEIMVELTVLSGRSAR